MSGPIKPKEVQKKKNATIPEAVFDAFNKLIAENWDGCQSTVNQDEVAELIADALNISTAKVYERKLLDVEGAYSDAGWDVTYDKPGYNEDYKAVFKFRK